MKREHEWLGPLVVSLLGVCTGLIMRGQYEDKIAVVPSAQAAEEERVDLFALISPSDACRGEWLRHGWLVGWSRDDTWATKLTVWCQGEGGVNDSSHRVYRLTQMEGEEAAYMEVELEGLFMEPGSSLKSSCEPGTFVGWDPKPRYAGQYDELGRVWRQTDGVYEKVMGVTDGQLYCLQDGNIVRYAFDSYDKKWLDPQIVEKGIAHTDWPSL